MVKLEGYNDTPINELTNRAIVHDKSKYDVPEIIPYMWLT